MPKFLVFLIGLCLVAPCAKALDLEIAESTSSGISHYDVIARGVIEKGDRDKLFKVLRLRGEFPGDFRIRSPGGDGVEAIEIGRLLRRGLIPVASFDKCASACFLVLVAGVTRQPLTPVGIHRPKYDESYFASLTASEAQRKYQELDAHVRQYLVDMTVPTQTIDRMMRISSGDVQFN